jgi:hypothetical protein
VAFNQFQIESFDMTATSTIGAAVSPLRQLTLRSADLHHGYFTLARVFGSSVYGNAPAAYLQWEPSQTQWITITVLVGDRFMDDLIEAVSLDQNGSYFNYDTPTSDFGIAPATFPITWVQIAPVPPHPGIGAQLAHLVKTFPELKSIESVLKPGNGN